MKKVYINPGHSDKDTGAVGYEIERELNVKTAEQVKLMVTHGSNNSPYEAADETTWKTLLGIRGEEESP